MGEPGMRTGNKTAAEGAFDVGHLTDMQIWK